MVYRNTFLILINLDEVNDTIEYSIEPSNCICSILPRQKSKRRKRQVYRYLCE